MHPDNDELLQVLEGEVDIEVLTEEGSEIVHVGAGSFFVVPRSHWHRHRLSGLLKELYLTLGRTETSMGEDPREADT
jgi:mannose-6-phosphate isomerase-like protein (cupin superfamily)